MSERVEKLRRDYDAACEAAQAAVEARDRARMAYQRAAIAEAALKAGIAVGDVVRHNGAEYKVVRLDGHGSYLWLVVVGRVKSGAWGKRERTIYGEWTRVE